MDLDPGFKDRVKWAISAKETSQSALARHLGLSAQAIQQWAAGATTSPRRDYVQRAAQFLGCRFEWLAYGRGPMKVADGEQRNPTPPEGATEAALLSHEWERALLAAMPEGASVAWQTQIPHPSGLAALRVDWATEHVLAEIGLYRHPDTLIQNARQRLWLLVMVRELLPPSIGRRTILLLSPLEAWRETPDRHIAALRAEARVLGVEVLEAATPENAAAILTQQAEAPRVPANGDLGLDASPLI